MKEDFFIPTIISGLVLVLGIFISIKAFQNLRKKAKYEFENRRGGGVVGFNSYEESVRHKRSKSFNGCLLTVGILTILISFFIFRMLFAISVF